MTSARALAELQAVLDAVDPGQTALALDLIAGAGAIMGAGCGREGLMIRALIMRLHHLGLCVSMQGDMAAPPLGPGDLLLVAAGPGDLPTTTALIRIARAAGARVLAITAEPGRLPDPGPDVLHLPARTMAGPEGGVLPMGSVFEGALWLWSELAILSLRDRLGQTPAMMRRRHTNME